jgi:hypothetical protein
MRRYYMVFGILLILPIIDFAVGAPVPAQEKLQAGVDVAHPGDAITMMGKRGDPFEDLYLMLVSRPSKSWQPSMPSGGWTKLKQPLSPIPEEPPLEPNPASSPANSEPSSPSTTASMEEFMSDGWWDGEEGLVYDPTSSDGSDNEMTAADAPQPNTNPRPSEDPNSDRNDRTNLEGPPPPKRPKPSTSKEFGQAQENEVAPVQPNPGPSDPGPSNPWKGFGQAQENVQPNPGPSNPGLPTEPVLALPSPDSQPLDPQAALYAAKGKAKLERRVPGAARDVGNAVQRELQLAERMLDPGK